MAEFSTNYDKNYQIMLIAHLYHCDNLLKIAVNELAVEDFELPACQVIFEALHDYYKQFKKSIVSSDIFLNEVERIRLNANSTAKSFLRENELDSLVDIISSIFEYPVKKPLNPDYFMASIADFARNVKLSRLIDRVQSSGAGKTSDLLSDLTRIVKIRPSLTSRMTKVTDDPELLMSWAEEKRVPTGLLSLDSRFEGGLGLGEMGMFTAVTGVGKSTALMNFCYGAMLAGIHCLFITLELKPKDIKRRMQGIAAGIKAKYFKLPMDAWPSNIISIYDQMAQSNLFDYLTIMDFSCEGKTPLETIEKSIEEWQDHIMEEYGPTARSWMVAVDHIDKVEEPAFKRKLIQGYEAKADISEYMSDLARRRMIALWTATQGNGKAVGEEKMNITHTGAAIHKNFPVTLALGLAPKIAAKDNDSEDLATKEANCVFASDVMLECDRDMVISIMKNRNGADGKFYIMYQGPTLKFWDKRADSLQEAHMLSNGHLHANIVNYHRAIRYNTKHVIPSDASLVGTFNHDINNAAC